MADKARKQTDKELAHLERKIYRLYATSQTEISEKWRKYMSSHKKKLDKLYNELQEAKKSGDKDAIRTAEEEYERAVKNVTLNDKRYKAMINETTAKIANVNQIALDYVNGDMPKIYTLNYNAFDDEKIDGYTFTLTNEKAVENLIKSNKIELPPKKVNIPKDQAWNAKNINSQLLQGIIQGESIAKIAKRLQNVTDMNKKSAIRNARTMVTGAENKGRQDSFKRAQDDGVIIEREWIAAHDDRTRAWHLDLNGVRVGVDEPWENDYGEIMYPGDPTADPANVYNCRCSIRAHVKGFNWNQKFQESKEKEAYQYHATKSSSIVGIIEKGLKPNRGHVGKGVYFANSPEDAVEWTTETSTGGRTVLRVKESFLNVKGLQKWAANESGYDLAENVYEGIVPFDQIEVKVGDNEWWSLAKYAEQHRNLVYNKLTPAAKKKVDKIVKEEWEEYLKSKRYR